MSYLEHDYRLIADYNYDLGVFINLRMNAQMNGDYAEEFVKLGKRVFIGYPCYYYAHMYLKGDDTLCFINKEDSANFQQPRNRGGLLNIDLFIMNEPDEIYDDGGIS